MYLSHRCQTDMNTKNGCYIIKIIKNYLFKCNLNIKIIILWDYYPKKNTMRLNRNPLSDWGGLWIKPKYLNLNSINKIINYVKILHDFFFDPKRLIVWYHLSSSMVNKLNTLQINTSIINKHKGHIETLIFVVSTTNQFSIPLSTSCFMSWLVKLCYVVKQPKFQGDLPFVINPKM